MPTPPPYFSFLPWGRRGIAAQINESEMYGTPPVTPTVNERAEITVKVHVQADSTPQTPLPVSLQIIGPGDVIGISPDAVVRTEPKNWVTNFEPHSFAFIDFYEEDFPWRYTPAKAANDQKLRPWLTLVVLKDDEFTRNPITEGAPLNSIKLTGTPALPKHDELWAWAHIQVNNKIAATPSTAVNTAVTQVNTFLNDNPDIAISRIVCPRQLEDNMGYTAFLIPTYEVGRLAGLGIALPPAPQQIKAQEPAWGTTLTPVRVRADEFPVYYEWFFRTGTTGDFEYLVRQLIPRVLDQRIGRRRMDTQWPGYNLAYTDGTGPTKATLVLEGALRVPPPTPPPASYPYPDVNGFRSALRHFINLGYDINTPPVSPDPPNPWIAGNPSFSGGTFNDDPVISAPLYGRWHALRNRVYLIGTAWVDELNLDPRHRVAAALGGDYVRKNQEELMDLAWDQVGMVLEANKLVNWGQLGVESSNALYKKNLEQQPPEQGIAMTSRVQSKVISGGVSLKQTALASRLPEGADSASFRRIRRPGGPLMKRIDPGTTSFSTTLLQDLAQGNVEIAPDIPPPPVARFTAAELETTIGDSQTVATGSLTFSIMSPGVVPTVGDPQEANGFKSMLSSYNSVFTQPNWQPLQADPNLNVSSIAAGSVVSLNPLVAVPNAFYASKKFLLNYVEQPPPNPGAIVPAMAAPSFVVPMYQSLKSLGLDYFIPNLNLMPQNTISLLESNPKFIESFLVGANYEMARELLWREYPTDQRGTYFRHFWDTNDNIDLTNSMTPAQREIAMRDITDIASWPYASNLGAHNGRTGTNQDPKIILAIRGDFLKRFPQAVIFAVKAKWQMNGNVEDHTVHRLIDPGTEKFPVFNASVDPDITFLGFDITTSDAKGNSNVTGQPGWFFMIMERPGELRFGIDSYTGPPLGTPPYTVNTWQDLTWDHVATTSKKYINLFGTGISATDPTLPPATPGSTTVNWASDAAAMAMIIYQNPVKVAIHAREMLQ